MGVMANALFDLDVGSPYIYPYLGLGMGYQSTRLDGFALTATNKPFSVTASGQAGGFAAQAIGGLSFPIPNMPGLSLTIDYRIMDILGGEKFNGTTSFGAGPGTTSAIKFHNQFDQTVMFGVRYAFNTPPPAVTTASASGNVTLSSAAPTGQIQTYLVSFDSDQASLNDHAEGIVKEAAQASTGRQGTRIEVTGNAGGPALSDRRAKAVAAALIGEGVPKDSIAIQSRGDANPPNRRVRIVTE
jgi:hypothetical protein